MGLPRAYVLGVCVLALAVAALACGGPAGARGEHSSLKRELAELVRDPHGPPGVSVLIKTPGHTQHLAFGRANVATGRRMSPALPMRIASVAKAFNGAVILSLVDRGKLGLSDRFGKWLPGVWPKARDVTVREMLGHQGGLPEYIDDPQFRAFLGSHPRAYKTPRQILDYVTDDDLDYTPGTSYKYSDTDNIALGLIAEKATGSSYEALLRRLVYRRAGLHHLRLPRSVKMPQPFMHGYDVVPGGPDVDASKVINPALAWASGGIVANQYELGRFFRAYVGGKLFGRGLQNAQTRQMPDGASSPPGPGANRAGLGLFRYGTHCGAVFGHTGSFPGYRQFAAANRSGRRSVVFTVNAQIVPGQGEQAERVSDAIRAAQLKAVCKALR